MQSTGLNERGVFITSPNGEFLIESDLSTQQMHVWRITGGTHLGIDHTLFNTTESSISFSANSELFVSLSNSQQTDGRFVSTFRFKSVLNPLTGDFSTYKKGEMTVSCNSEADLYHSVYYLSGSNDLVIAKSANNFRLFYANGEKPTLDTPEDLKELMNEICQGEVGYMKNSDDKRYIVGKKMENSGQLQNKIWAVPPYPQPRPELLSVTDASSSFFPAQLSTTTTSTEEALSSRPASPKLS